ncbi:hypothetical protein RSSM_03280 [Rhodopirellula sallentina SM41]|uniref:Uncharacterized protein n=1 Tax=Rhodopirellula sallentina SM41 TaxID=1263870 RepID=M5UBM7_9BACT|nr:hypothetical protein RSSM_03280 [Rhodopirellula sallentina SM41]
MFFRGGYGLDASPESIPMKRVAYKLTYRLHKFVDGPKDAEAHQFFAKALVDAHELKQPVKSQRKHEKTRRLSKV